MFMKTYKINEILPALNLSSYDQKCLTEIIAINEKVNALYPSEVVLTFSEEDGKEYYHHAEIKMVYKGVNFYVKYWDYKKKFVIYEDFLRTLKNIDRYAIQRIEENFKEPQQIGVLSHNKLINWFEYYLAIIDVAKQVDAQNGGEKEAFLKSIEGLPVKWWNNGVNGEIIQNGVKFSFAIGETYISKKIEIDYKVNDNLESFLQLSNNKYNK